MRNKFPIPFLAFLLSDVVGVPTVIFFLFFRYLRKLEIQNGTARDAALVGLGPLSSSLFLVPTVRGK